MDARDQETGAWFEGETSKDVDPRTGTVPCNSDPDPGYQYASTCIRISGVKNLPECFFITKNTGIFWKLFSEDCSHCRIKLKRSLNEKYWSFVFKKTVSSIKFLNQ